MRIVWRLLLRLCAIILCAWSVFLLYRGSGAIGNIRYALREVYDIKNFTAEPAEKNSATAAKNTNDSTNQLSEEERFLQSRANGMTIKFSNQSIFLFITGIAMYLASYLFFRKPGKKKAKNEYYEE